MTFPPGIEAARGHKPLLADYFLGLCAVAFGLHVLYFPESALTAFKAWDWIAMPAWTLATIALGIGLLQWVAAVTLCAWARRASAVLACALYVDFTVKVFGGAPHAPISSQFLAVAIGNAFLAFWPSL
jgi:hypothetical protein